VREENKASHSVFVHFDLRQTGTNNFSGFVDVFDIYTGPRSEIQQKMQLY